MAYTDENNKRVVLQIRIEKELKEQFQQVCKNKDINTSALLRTLITNWLQENNK